MYIVSFCKKPDILSQWRGYGKKGGYAIGFDRDSLNLILAKEYQQYRAATFPVEDVIYSDSKKEHFLEELVDLLLKSNIATDSIIVRDLIRKIPFFKNSNFSEENEVRFVIQIPWKEDKKRPHSKEKMVFFREKCGTLIPYIKIAEDESLSRDLKAAMKHIIIGPANNQERRKESLDIILHRYGISPKLEYSSIPYVLE